MNNIKLIFVNKPITKEDIRFMELWQEQRKGSKAGYYLLYTFSWGLAIIFIIFFILMFLGGISIIPIAEDNNKIVLIVAIGFILGFLTSLLTRGRNEKRFKQILSRVKKDVA